MAKVFEWDRHNLNSIKAHGMRAAEAEEALSIHPILIYDQDSDGQPRYVYCGETASLRLLAVVLTERNGKIRVITGYELEASQSRDYFERRLKGEWPREKQRPKRLQITKIANEHEEALWWTSAEGRKFLKAQTSRQQQKALGGSKLVSKIAKASSVQIALRLPSPDLDKAREIAERKGIGYQTSPNMIVHEGLRRVDRQSD